MLSRGRLLLCVGAAQGTLARWRAGRLVDCTTFPADEAGLLAFAGAVAHHTRVPLHALVDAVEEDYRFEHLPHAGARDRSAMVERRARQRYRTSPFHGATRLGRSAEGRRDDRYLFAALTNPDIFTPWATAIQGAGLALAGLHPLPMLMPVLAQRLGVGSVPSLLVVSTAAGLRQSFIVDGELRLSRLTPHAPDRERAALAVDEIAATCQYLEALRLRTADVPLDVVLVETRDSLVGVLAALEPRVTGLRCQRIPASALAQRLALDEGDIARMPDLPLLALLGRQRPLLNLAPAASLERHRVLGIQRSLYAAAGVVGISALGFGAASVLQQRQALSNASAHQAEARAWQARYEAATREFPAAPASLETLQRTVDSAQAIARVARTPERALAAVSAALDAQPEILLRRVVWRMGAPPGETDAPATGAGSQGVASRNGPRTESVVLEGEVAGMGGDLRQTIARIDALAVRLRADPRVLAATVTRLPLNLSPGGSLSGNTRERPEQADSGATFRLVILLQEPRT